MFGSRYWEAAVFFAVKRSRRTGRRHWVRKSAGVWIVTEVGA